MIAMSLMPVLGCKVSLHNFQEQSWTSYLKKVLRMLKHIALTSQQWWLSLQPRSWPQLPQDRRTDWGVTCLSRLFTLGSVSPGRVLSPAAFVRPIHVIAPEPSALHLRNSVEGNSVTMWISDSKQGRVAYNSRSASDAQYRLERVVFFLGLINDKIFQWIQRAAQETHFYVW